ncbi:type IV pilus biogenesis/stability protein PilW [Phaeovulum sp.]|uniref:tetratricopeptide repeat protein n=1 Tax=Phaeovulum sp. TaxID=2934796 RepID=UPI0035674C46
MIASYFAAVLAAVLLTLTPAWAATLDSGTAQEAALQAASEGRNAEALALARAILEVSPNDPFAHYVIGTVMLWQGDLAAAERAGKNAYRAATSKLQKHESARLVATAAFASDEALSARYWLRHAAATAPDPTRERAALQALAALREATPWGVQLRFSLQPSNNVNAGASSRFNVIDGIPVVGVLSDDALALPGVVGTLDARLSYRLRANETSRSEVSALLFLRAVELAGDPTTSTWSASEGWVETEISNAAYGSAAFEIEFGHTLAATERRGSIGLDAAVGRTWSGGSFSYDYLRLGANVTPRAAGFFYSAALEARAADGSLHDATIASLSGGWRTSRANGDHITLSLGLRNVESPRANSRGTTASVQLRYAPAKTLGPVAWQASVGFSQSDYPDYTTGLFMVPGGRQEQLGYAEVDLWLPSANFAGFAPQLKLRALETRSNVSSFERRELSIGFGFRSQF